MMGKMQYYRVVVDCWRMFHKYLLPAMSGRVDWEALNAQALKIGRQYGESKFVKALIFAFLDEIERVQKERSR
ncbi:hypothetical protein AALA00_12160 [Lachnospiraceae bacterium 46-15]